MKKNAILTHPLNSNYGGILQAFALQRTLQLLSVNSDVIAHSFTCINFKIYGRKNLKKTLFFFLKFLFGKPTYECNLPPFFQGNIFKQFITKHISLTQPYLPEEMEQIQANYDRWIVGSDQVWRLQYTRYLGKSFFFLDFLPEEKRNSSFSYAASFGTNKWEGTPEETKKCAQLLRQFKAVSVREHSGITICREIFGVNAVQMPDPTLLLSTDEYETIIRGGKTHDYSTPYIASYVLNSTDDIQFLLASVGERLSKHVQQLTPQVTGKKIRDRFPTSVAQWLRSIRDADYMITDSFHGCVFSIIYNIPFVCLDNKNRGSARFDTLLKTFGLEERLMTDYHAEKAQKILSIPIDWERVNSIHESERRRGLDFLKTNLAD